MLRNLLIEVCWRPWRATLGLATPTRGCTGSSSRKKIAIVALARKLVVAVGPCSEMNELESQSRRAPHRIPFPCAFLSPPHLYEGGNGLGKENM